MEDRVVNTGVFRFGDYELDTARRLLTRSGEPLELNAKAFDLLANLVAHHGEVVSKDDLLDHVWPGQTVEENNLTVQISAIRKALGATAGASRFISTIPGKGYCFVAEVTSGDIEDEIIVESRTVEHITFEQAAEPAQPLQLAAARPTRWPIFAGVAILLLAVAGFAGWRYLSAQRSIKTDSIAVLPFTNETSDASNDYLSDGLAESVMYALSKIPAMKVISRNSTFRYRGQNVDARTIGADLNARAVLTGRMSRTGNLMNVTAELTSTEDNSIIWGEQFSRQLTDIEKLQSDIANAISAHLRVKLNASSNGTESAEAYHLYLKGRQQWNRRTAESLKQAAAFYNQALEKDPGYALAYSGLAETYVLFSSYDVASSKDSMPQGKAAAIKALELDETLPQAHTALGFYLSYYEWDWTGAEREFRRAIELDPNYATAHQWLGSDCLATVGRFDEALASLRRAEELDPLSSVIGKDIGYVLGYARRYDDSIAKLKRVVALDSDFAVAHGNLSMCYRGKGMFAEAISENKKALELSYDPIGIAELAQSLAKAGRTDEARLRINELKEMDAKRYVPSYAIAVAHLSLGENREALVYLEREVDDHGYWAGVYAIAPELDGLRADPQFQAMLRRMNLPELDLK